MVASDLPQPYSGNHPFLRYLSRLWRKAEKKRQNSPLWMRLYPRFTLKELITATDNFRSKIGEDGFYTLYKGFIKNSYKDTIAIRRFKSGPREQLEFVTEMELRSHLHHPNIVSLMGYCLDGSESDAFIIDEYMPGGTLYDRLHNSKDSQPLLSWKKRLEICIGAARGLEFLHTGNHSIIHRDIKTSNILLDQNWAAKISDFGLARLVPTSLLESDGHVTTDFIAGTMGYMAPEYVMTGQLSKKSDVYSFGVVLFEVLCARKRRDIILEDGRDLVQWCRDCVEDGRLDEIVDPRLNNEIEPECLKAYVDMAYRCSNERSSDRPTTDAVLKRLELTILLQECIEADIPFSPSWLRAITLPPKRREPFGEPSGEPFEEIEFLDSELSDDYDVEELLRD
ncbi:hypothetical protein DITRI_Ditri15bG0020700 [Diplodiscus trichospermus]